MIEKEQHVYLDEEEAALIISPDGTYQLLVPDDAENVPAMVLQILMKVVANEELLQLVINWEPEADDFNLGDAEEVWH